MYIRHRLFTAIAMAAVLVPACGGGSKRPPALARGGPRAPAQTTAPSDVPQPVEYGPDLQPIEADGARAEDFSVEGPMTGEGGPLSDVYFEYDQATLTDETRATLEKHALWLQGRREARVNVEGHCDERGTAEYNLALGDQRARAVKDYLVRLGVAGDRLGTVSYGKERPLDPSSTEQAWSKNRRAHFVVSR